MTSLGTTSRAAAMLLSLGATLLLTRSGAGEAPRVLDPHYQIEQIAAEPDLATPTGACFDDHGRLLVIACHTHFPPEDYAGPKVDQIWVFDDANADGVLDRQRLFHAGESASMNLVNLGDGWIALATRGAILRLRDGDGDGAADQREVLVEHQTEGDYPHNGLGGLTLGADGWLYIGQGENLGESYALVGTDGSRQSGGGEGGNVFRCRPDGNQVERVATGFWNPFGLCTDRAGRLWAVGNDPDSMPPNRLLNVVSAGDYGFQFRFGRAGVHPLQSWNGEFPGTLPMVSGVGEAACTVAVVGNELWVTSWGDNRIERHKLVQRGASWSSTMEVVVQGGSYFRPVAMAFAPDGSIYVTDWVDRSYPVHGKGRVWRISRRPEAPPVVSSGLPELTEPELAAKRMREDATVNRAERLEALDDDDPFLRQAAIGGLVALDQLGPADLPAKLTPRQKVGVLTAWRWVSLTDPDRVAATDRLRLLRAGLGDADDDVVRAALRWTTELRLQELQPQVEALLARRHLSAEVFRATVASIAYLETGSAASGRYDPAIEERMIAFAGDGARSPELRAAALHAISLESPHPEDSQLLQWLRDEPDGDFAIEVVYLLEERATDAADATLVQIAADDSFSGETRADALAALAGKLGRYQELVTTLADDDSPAALRTEARRILHDAAPGDASSLPAPDDLDAWLELVGEGGDRAAGRRVFRRKTCARCHAYSGHGAATGPDLSTLSEQTPRRRLLESILTPAKEIGPLYVPWTVVTTDGKAVTGLKLNPSGNEARVQQADGEIVGIPLDEIEYQAVSDQSIMPEGLEKTMTIDELRDLLAYLAR